MKFTPLALAATLMFAATAQANESVIRKALTQQFPGATIASVQKTPYSGLFEVYLDGQLIYVDAKAQYVFAGDVIDLKNRTNLTPGAPESAAGDQVGQPAAQQCAEDRQGQAASASWWCSPTSIAPTAASSRPSSPRSTTSPSTPSSTRSRACIRRRCRPRNRSGARPTATRRGTTTSRAARVPSNDGKCANPVDATIALGNKLKVGGTPTLFFANGQRVPGMVPAAQLERLLAANAK